MAVKAGVGDGEKFCLDLKNGTSSEGEKFCLDLKKAAGGAKFGGEDCEGPKAVEMEEMDVDDADDAESWSEVAMEPEPEEQGCDSVQRFRWFNMGWVAEVELDYKTKQVTYISENDDGEQIRSPPNGIWYIQRNPDTGLHRYVIFFHYKGNVEYSKKHILYQDQPGHMVCRTKHGEAGSSKGWTAMWPVG